MKTKILSGKQLLQSVIFILILSMALVSCTSEPVLPTADEAKIAVMEKINMANDRWSSGDPTGFLKIVAEDVIWMDDLGAMIPINGKEALVPYLESFKGVVPEHTKELYNFIFQFYGDIVIVNYRYQGTIEGVKADPWKISVVYHYEDGDWLSVHENWSEVKPPPQAEME
jgi:nuclear transport factor 2 (NTF2) superfamily protein